MKKVIIAFLLLYGCNTPTFKEDTHLVKANPPERRITYAAKLPPAPFLLIYQKKGKTLILVAADHGPKSLLSVHYAFGEYHPQIALIEREPGFPLGNCMQHEDAYTAALSAKNNIPLVRTDADYKRQWEYAKRHGFSYEDFQMQWIIKNADGVARYDHKQPSATEEIENYKRDVHNPDWGELFTEDRLLAYFQKNYDRNFNTTDFIQFRRDLQGNSPEKWVRKTPFYKMMHNQPDVRSVFMLQNITAALNEYEVVFSEMGSGHFVDIYDALNKMLGNPRFVRADQIPPQELWKECSLEGLQEKVLIKD